MTWWLCDWRAQHTHAVLILDAVLATPNLVYSDIRRLAGKVTQFYAVRCVPRHDSGRHRHCWLTMGVGVGVQEKMAVLQPAMLDMVVFIPFAGMLWESFVLEVWNRIFVSDQQTNAIVRRVAKREPGRRRRSFFKRLFNSDKKNKYALTAPQFILLTHLFNTMRQRFRNDWGVIDGSSGVLPELLRRCVCFTMCCVGRCADSNSFTVCVQWPCGHNCRVGGEARCSGGRGMDLPCCSLLWVGTLIVLLSIHPRHKLGVWMPGTLPTHQDSRSSTTKHCCGTAPFTTTATRSSSRRHVAAKGPTLRQHVLVRKASKRLRQTSLRTTAARRRSLLLRQNC